MYTRKPTRSFRKSLGKISLSGIKGINQEIERVIEEISKGNKLAKKHQDHQLSGPFKNFRECHIRPDLLLIYQISENNLFLVNIGSHSDLFS